MTAEATAILEEASISLLDAVCPHRSLSATLCNTQGMYSMYSYAAFLSNSAGLIFFLLRHLSEQYFTSSQTCTHDGVAQRMWQPQACVLSHAAYLLPFLPPLKGSPTDLTRLMCSGVSARSTQQAQATLDGRLDFVYFFVLSLVSLSERLQVSTNP
jgi:hypothetical protein